MDARLAVALAAARDHNVALAQRALATPSPPPASNQGAPPAPVSPHEQSTAVKTVAAVTERNSEPEEEGAIALPPTLEDAPVASFDDAAEAAFLGEAKERGEVVKPKPAMEAEETNPKALPPLDDLVRQIPPNVREALEDLFRARFVAVKRFPKKAMKP